MKKRICIRQQDLADCGAACLASVAAYHRYYLPVSRIRQQAGTDVRGTTMQGMVTAANRMGFEAKAVRGMADHLDSIPLPAIAHLSLPNGLQHYVVLYRVRKNRVVFMDPVDGRVHHQVRSAFQVLWTGVMLLLVPAADFQHKDERVSPAGRFWQLVRPHRRSLIGALAGVLMMTLLGLSTSFYVQKIIDLVWVDSNTRLLNLLSMIMLVLLVFELIIGLVKTVISLQVAQHIDTRLILGYYQHVLQLPQQFFDTLRMGEIISRVNDAVKIRHFVNEVALNGVLNLLVVFFSITLMFLYYWKLALLMLAAIPCYILLYRIANRTNGKWQRVLMERGAALETQLTESLYAAATIKGFGMEAHAAEKTEHRLIALLKSVYRSQTGLLYVATAVSFMTRFFTIGILWLGSYFVINRELTPGELFSFYALLEYFTGPVIALINSNKDLQEALIAADRLYEIIDLETEKVMEPTGVKEFPAGDICFRNIAFGYGNRGQVLDNLTLHFPAGSYSAIVGESGSGKSTVLHLLQGLYPVQKGTISLGGTDIRYISPNHLRQWVSVVPQKADFFAGTLLENICMGDEDPDMQWVLSLCRRLGIDDFLASLPMGYNSPVKERGANLSGGQKQLLAIARALYRNPEVLVLDEATSSLDIISEEKVRETLQWYNDQGKTIITVAHRLGIVRHCCPIHVLHQGRLMETGSHETLLNSGGYYLEMWQRSQ